MSIPFDPTGFIQELEATGVPVNQATVHAKALSTIASNAVSLQDLHNCEDHLKQEIQHCEERLGCKIDQLKTMLLARCDQIEAKFEAKFEVLRAEFGALRAELIVHRWALGLVLALTASNTAILFRMLFR